MAAVIFMALVSGVACVSGCASPPSVAPLLRIGERAMREEAQRLRDESVRDTAQVDQVRRSLATAFEADLAATPTMSHAWVLDAAEVYAAAREALAEHGAALRRERERRALELLEQQDRLIVETLGVDVWRVLQQSAVGAEGDVR